MRICSWDVGIYNLSYCILEENDITKDIKILKWDIVNLVDNDSQKKNRTLLFENIPIKLNQIPELLEVDYVFIENQPVLKNPQMKSIQMILYSYFLFYGVTDGITLQITRDDGTIEEKTHKIKSVDFCSASNKLKVYNGPTIAIEDLKKKPSTKKAKKKVEIPIDIEEEVILDSEDEDYELHYQEALERIQEKKKLQQIQSQTIIDPTTQSGGSSIKYADKKKLAIAHATYFLETQEQMYMDFFKSHKKRDDLADSFLQGIYVFKKVLNKPEKKSRKKKDD